MFKFKLILAVALLAFVFGSEYLVANQKMGFINSEVIRKKFPEAQLAEQRLQTMVEEWKREAADLQKQIEDLEFEIKKNRLIWSDTERAEKEKKLEDIKTLRDKYITAKFQPNGEYDMIARRIMAPVEERIYQATQKVAQQQRYDFVYDQSMQPLPVSNYKFDITVLVLKELGVDVAELEAELQQKVESDPRNEQREDRTPRSRTAPRYDPEGKPVPAEGQEEEERSFQRRRR